MNNRRQSREKVFALLFEWSFNEEKSIEEILVNATDARDIKLDPFTTKLVDTTFDNMKHINDMIEKYSDSWKLNRISRVSLAGLRMALCEIMYFDDIPYGATINEAVELAKKYGAEDDSSYINGILGSVTREKQPKEGHEL